MTLYEELAAAMGELLAEAGGPGTLISGTTSFNKQTGRTTSTNSATTNVTVLVGPQFVTEVEGRKVTRAEATLTVKPTEGDKLVVGSQTYIVGKVTIYPVQNQPTIYVAEVS